MALLVVPARSVLFLGRGQDCSLALEGTRNLKEISYIHAEGYAAGEMKHGLIALIDDQILVVVLISDAEGLAQAGDACIATIEMPQVRPLIAPLVYAIPVRLLA